MGGDDLGSDDEYLTAPLQSAVENDHNDDDDDRSDHSSDDDDLDRRDKAVVSPGNHDNNNNKRKRDTPNIVEKQQQQTPSSQSKRSKKDGNGGPLRKLGMKILDESTQSKAELLSNYAGVQFLPNHMARLSNSSNGNAFSNNFMDRLLSIISKKQLKKSTTQKSPKAIVVCLSARRCVAVLKDLVPLKLRVAKLFPKQGTMEEQAQQLETTEFGLAIGTPHRIKELLERGSLSLKGTTLLGLDVFENDKSFSVYTLADTAVPTQELLKEHVFPQCAAYSSGSKSGNRKGQQELKVAFV